METLTINTANGPVEVPIKPNSEIINQRMGADFVQLYFDLREHQPFDLGDWIEVFGKKYFINTQPQIRKLSSNFYEYSLVFESQLYDFGKTVLLDLDASGIHFGSEFFMTGTLDDFASLLKTNLARVYGEFKWDVQNTYNVDDIKTISFSDDNCLKALHKISDAFDVDFELVHEDPDEYELYLYFRQEGGYVNQITFEYGKGKGLTEIKLAPNSTDNFVTRLWAFGFSRNLGPSYRGFSPRLRLPVIPDFYVLILTIEIVTPGVIHITGQTDGDMVQLQTKAEGVWGDAFGYDPIPASEFNAGEIIVTGDYPATDEYFRLKAWKTSEPEQYVFSDGSNQGIDPKDYIENELALAKYGAIERTVIFEEVYPSRTGTITFVSNDELSNIQFVDSEMFNLNEVDEDFNTLYLLPGVTPKIAFKTGNLAGYEFELVSYSHEKRVFVIAPIVDERNLTIPNSNPAFQFNIGDKYTILDILLPQPYIDEAEQRLLSEAQRWLDLYSHKQNVLTVTLDPMFLKNSTTNYRFKPGDLITIFDAALEIDNVFEIESSKRKLVNPWQYEIAFSEKVYNPSAANQSGPRGQSLGGLEDDPEMKKMVDRINQMRATGGGDAVLMR